MSAKRVVGRGLAIGLGIVCIILVVGMVGTMAYYTMAINDKNATYDSYVSSHSHTNSEYNTLNSQVSSLNAQKASLQDQVDSLNLQINSLNAQLANSQNTITSLTSQVADLQNQVDSLNSQINSLNAQIASLQSQISTLESPKLVKVNLVGGDNRPWFQTPYLHVYGYICNVGSHTAYNCKLHVVAYQSGGVVAIDTYINFGSVGGESWTSVDSNVYYSGSALTSWSITPQWTG